MKVFAMSVALIGVLWLASEAEAGFLRRGNNVTVVNNVGSSATIVRDRGFLRNDVTIINNQSPRFFPRQETIILQDRRYYAPRGRTIVTPDGRLLFID